MDIIRSNAHMHTTFCDGKNTVEEMVKAAVDRNFISAGFSIHGWTPYDSSIADITCETAYREEVRRIRDLYNDRIEILLGVECDALYQRDYSEYEYRIDSTHYFYKDGILLCVDYSQEQACENVRTAFGGDWYAYCREYFRREADVCAASTAAFIGHIDLITKYNEGGRYFDTSDPRFLKPAFEAVDCALERNIPLEMNTGAIARGYRSTPYPDPAILRRIHEKGGEIIINSDAHSAHDIDCRFEDCVLIARECGFDHILRMRRSGFEEVPLY